MADPALPNVDDDPAAVGGDAEEVASLPTDGTPDDEDEDEEEVIPEGEAPPGGGEAAEGADFADLQDDPDLAGSAPGSSASQLWGKVGHLTDVQMAAYADFRKQVPEQEFLDVKNPHETVEHNALRWLRARDFKVKEAIKMIRAHRKYVANANVRRGWVVPACASTQ
jgi:hypothetical protein